MIYKSYIIEQNIDKIENNIALFYGENLGLIDDFKQLIKKSHKSSKIIRFNEEEILKNDLILIREISNKSLFEEEKIILIDQSTDKVLSLILEVEKINNDTKIYLFSGILEKKSKLRSHFEKSKNLSIVPCYEDNEINLKTIILNYLKNYKGLTTRNVNMILENCNQSRTKLKNELCKIENFFLDKNLNTERLEDLLNLRTNENFNQLKDSAFLGDKRNTNQLLSDSILEVDKNIFYLNIINQRAIKLREIKRNSENIEKAVNNMRPPIFWKDKQNFISQAKIWNEKKLKSIIKKTYDIEVKIKSSSSINIQILIKKLLIDLCVLANA